MKRRWKPTASPAMKATAPATTLAIPPDCMSARVMPTVAYIQSSCGRIGLLGRCNRPPWEARAGPRIEVVSESARTKIASTSGITRPTTRRSGLSLAFRPFAALECVVDFLKVSRHRLDAARGDKRNVLVGAGRGVWMVAFRTACVGGVCDGRSDVCETANPDWMWAMPTVGADAVPGKGKAAASTAFGEIIASWFSSGFISCWRPSVSRHQSHIKEIVGHIALALPLFTRPIFRPTSSPWPPRQGNAE